jgi:iron complex outermembrane receptor protein
LNQKPHWSLIPLDETGKRYLADPINNQLLYGSITFNGRYQITGISGSQFSQLGTVFQMGLSFRL